MTDFSEKYLTEVLISSNHDSVSPAWQDDTNKDFLICYEVNLVFDDDSVFTIKPCEIDIEGRYPGLGLALKREGESTVSNKFELPKSPVMIKSCSYSDYLGEGTYNQIVFRLQDPFEITIRHVFRQCR
ncbi:hypothetical protein NLG07_10090 [Alteromonas sp. LMIT006]|uniref:hypothetical protein n=1 Tax=Alteromonadaceae TaxID=72275 RepID=UPI0020CA937D|nr:hypothetical protein [Alteromonas sp. LMIT006]UTP72331.1 hypothetical protein NLG07_10090 [Alteromonas sp. LMIT006]